ncbi:MAG TPA: efflux transporter outer membrane subunit [Acetobacteraceae bacterium]|jgi:outer membrane protein, multidrug efflux system|nr:efflux transporter outer membrane subunit [Acetobacteraceae bacterium]
MRARGQRAVGLGIGAAALLVLAGCDLGPDYHRPALEIPPAYRASAATAAAAWPSADWWRGFSSPELDSLIAQAQTENFDLLAAIARVQQADAQVRIAGAPLLPSLNTSASANWTQESLASFGRTGRGSISNIDLHDYTAGLNAAYAVDFWDKTLASRQAAVANAMFSRYDQQTVALTVVTSVASTWFNALGFADQLAVTQNNLADAEKTLAVIRGRLAVGTASALDVAQQESLVQGVRATIPNLRSQIEQQLDGLGILIGRPPEAVTVRPGTLATLTLPDVAPGLPSRLLERRPDVASAEAQLIAANFDVKSARAAFFPQVQLTGSAGFENVTVGALFGPGAFLTSAAASLTQPLFDGGTLRGQLEQAKGRRAELLEDYRKAVVQAFTDVDNALVAWRYATEQEGLQRVATETAHRAVDIARAQMEAGTADVTTVLTAETTYYGDENTLVQVRLARVQALLSLYKALGGGWKQPPGPVRDQFPGLSPGIVPGSVALPIGGNVQ